MIVKSQEISFKKKDFFLNKVIVIYGENQDLINDLNGQIISLCEGEGEGKNKNSKVIFEDDILKKPDDIINYYLNGSLFEENKNITIIKNCSDKILEIINSVKNNIQNTLIIINSEILQKSSKLRQFSEYDKASICIPCYQETKFDIKKFLIQQIQINKLELSENQIETILNFSSLKRSKIKEAVEKINIYKSTKKITDKIIEEICTENDLKKSDEIIDILLSKNEKNINDFISNMSNYEKNFIEIIIILRSFIMKILDIQKIDKKLSMDEKLERYKPPIFWKDKDRIKNILKIWSSKNLEKLLINLNIIETNFKRSELAPDTQFFYFLTQNLSKVAFKNANNFI
jgi:DNA polymerase-3 subunit delta